MKSDRDLAQQRGVEQKSIGEQLKLWRTRSHISQLELALECNSSSRHLSFLETGKAHPTRELLLDLTRVLHVPLRSRNTLLISAGYAPLFEETGLSDQEMKEIRNMLSIMVHKYNPYPSTLIDRHWNIIESNTTFQRMCSAFVHDASLLGKKPLNLLRIFLDPDCVGRSIQNFNDTYSTMLNRARRFVNIMGSDAENKNLLNEVLQYRPKNPKALDEDIPQLVMPLHLKKNELELSLFTMVATMGGPLNITLQEMQMEFALPTDENSNRVLLELVKNSDSLYE